MVDAENHCKDCCCAQSWKALGITEYTGLSIPEEIERLRGELENQTNERALYQALVEAAGEVLPNCSVCGKQAACIGLSSGAGVVAMCDDHCGHGQEDGRRECELVLPTLEDVTSLQVKSARLQAIVEKLPKTADGVPVVPGMRLYAPNPLGNPPISIAENVAVFADKDTYEFWYSTREAAEAAAETDSA